MTCTCVCNHPTATDKCPDKLEALAAYIDALNLADDMDERQGDLIAVLHKAQGLFGHLPREVQLFVAERFRVELSQVYGVVSFYSFFTTEPPGEFKVHVCTGTACFVRGADLVLAEFEKQLGIKDGQTRADRKYSLGGLRCVGACSLAPVVLVNDKVYGNVTPDGVADIIAACDRAEVA